MMFFREKKADTVELVNYVFERVLTDEEKRIIEEANPDFDIWKFIYETADEVNARYTRTDSLAVIYEFLLEFRSGVSNFRMRSLVLNLFMLKLFNCRSLKKKRWFRRK